MVKLKPTIRSKELVRELDQYSRTLRVYVQAAGEPYRTISHVFCVTDADGSNARIVIEIKKEEGDDEFLASDRRTELVAEARSSLPVTHAERGRLGGLKARNQHEAARVSTPAKAEAARRNGKLGGRPRKIKRT